MGNSNEMPSDSTPYADQPTSAVDPRFPASYPAPVVHESKRESPKDKGDSSSGTETPSLPSLFRSPPFQGDVDATSFVQAPFRPQTRGIFEDRHPLSNWDVFPSWYSVQALCDLMISYLPKEDYSSPVKFRPMAEYSPGGTVALALTQTLTMFDEPLPQHSLLRSMQDCEIFMPPPVVFQRIYGVEFDTNAMLHDLPLSHLEHLHVLYVEYGLEFKIFRDTLSRVKDLLKHLKILIVEVKKSAYASREFCEIFVFDLRDANDPVQAVINAVQTIQCYVVSNDVREILPFHVQDDENQWHLMDAVFMVDAMRFPFIKPYFDHPLCRWMFRLNESYSNISNDLLSKAHLYVSNEMVSTRVEDEPRSIRELDQLSDLSYFIHVPPLNGFVNDRLSRLHWSPSKPIENFTGFGGLANLQDLHMYANNVNRPITLQLDDTKRLSHLHLQDMTDWEIDVGPDPVFLDVLHLESFQGVMANIENLVIRDLQVNHFVQPNLVHLLCSQAENVRFVFNKSSCEDDDGNAKVCPDMFSDAKHLRCERTDQEMYNNSPNSFLKLAPMNAFSRLESLRLSNCSVQLFPSLFPVLRKLTLDVCHVLFPYNADEEAKGDQQRLHFEYLEECALKSCNIDSAGSEDDDLERIQYAFSAPNLKVLWYWENRGSASIFLNEASCPEVSTFRWSGPDFAVLPFDVTLSLDTPIFPKLRLLSLRVTNDEDRTTLPFPRLSTRLSIAQVSHLSLFRNAYICDLEHLQLQCRWAFFSPEVITHCCQFDASKSVDESDLYLIAAGKSMLHRMPRIQVLMIRNLYIAPEPESIVSASDDVPE